MHSQFYYINDFIKSDSNLNTKKKKTENTHIKKSKKKVFYI